MSSEERLKTGIRAIDSTMNGIFKGSLCTIIWDATGIGEVAGFHLCTSRDMDNRTSHYISNVRRVEDVKESIETISNIKNKADFSLDEQDHDVNIIDARDDNELRDKVTLLEDDISENDTVVIDDATEIKRLKTVNSLKRITRKSGVITYLNVPVGEPDPSFDRDMIKKFMVSDYVLKIDTEYAGSGVNRTLQVRKARGEEDLVSYNLKSSKMLDNTDTEPV